MKKVIIAIHGLGNKPSKKILQKWWKEAILEGFSASELNQKLRTFQKWFIGLILYMINL